MRMALRLSIFAVLAVLPLTLSAQEKEDSPLFRFRLGYGLGAETEALGQSMGSLYRGLGHTEDFFLDKMFDNKTSAGATGSRIAKGLALDIPLAFNSMLLLHENGHAENVRRYGGEPKISIDPGYFGSGFTTYDGNDWLQMDRNEHLDVQTGGVEATRAAAHALKKEMLEGSFIHWAHWPIWLTNKMDFSAYVLRTPPPDNPVFQQRAADGNDIAAFIQEFSAKSGKSQSRIYHSARRAALWNFLDPMFLAALYNYGGNYILAGNERAELPGIPLGQFKLMASTEGSITPAGPEKGIQIYFKDSKNQWLTEGSFRDGFDGAWGCGAGISNIPITDFLHCRAECQYWRQQLTEAPGKKESGFGASAGADFDFCKWGGIFTNAGYKTEGAWTGHPWDKGWFFSGGVNLRIPGK